MKVQNGFRPELLLPAGNSEAFHAALAGGADAIYLGLRDFNARGRASNFSPWQVATLTKKAHEQGVKVYITLNTVIRNTEINRLADTLFVLSQIKPDAVIIQDWGVYHLIRNFFPQLKLHASTQMANHNAIGVNYAAGKGFKRVVLARELTRSELKSIAQHTKAELELFVHGALCYSFSGMCLFSSYLGGASANRGLCAQPCRRIYEQAKTDNYFFSLKDNQLIEHLFFLEELKIDSLKVEGRLKSAEYVYQVARAYRKALDHPNLKDEAKAELLFDMGREKTDYFYGNSVSEAITQSANTGLFLGQVIEITANSLTFTSTVTLDKNCRLRFRSITDDRQKVIKTNDLKKEKNDYCFTTNTDEVTIGDGVYLAGFDLKFPANANTSNVKLNSRCPAVKMANIKSAISFQKKKTTERPSVFVRIDRVDWIDKNLIDAVNGVLLRLTSKELEAYTPAPQFIRQFGAKVWIELPKFISEGHIEQIRLQLSRLNKAGISNFVLSHLSQKELLPKNAKFMTNENVYLFNDAAIKQVMTEGATHYIYPLENDIVNLAKGTNRSGIIPVYFFPHLFYSRMPVDLEKEERFADKNGEYFRKTVKDGITLVLPDQPVSLTQYKSKLERYGFSNYLIDLSNSPDQEHKFAQIKRKLLASERVGSGSNFNFKRELK